MSNTKEGVTREIEMKKVTITAYLIVYFLFLCFFVTALFKMRLEVKGAPQSRGCMEITNYSRTASTDLSAPGGQKECYRFSVDYVVPDYNYLYFYSMHQDVRLYIDGECVYSLETPRNAKYLRSTGNVWNYVELFPKDSGKEILIEILPIYENAKNQDVMIYLGNRLDIVLHIIREELGILLMSIAVILAGFGFLGYALAQRKKGYAFEALLMFGAFSIFGGLWKISTTTTLGLAGAQYPVLSMVPYGLLMCMGLPYVLFVKNMINDSDGAGWHISCLACFVNIFVVVILMVFGIADMRQTMAYTQVTLLAVMLYCAVVIFARIEKYGFQKDLCFALACEGSCIIWFATDLGSYYFRGGERTSTIGITFFFACMCAVGLGAAFEAKELMAVGMSARKYEKIAFYDNLTGFYNRSAFVEYIHNRGFSPKNEGIAVFDMNDLKKCNDTLGHDKGDVYIKASAQIIRECFGDIGQCYRVGGDEFFVLIHQCSYEICQKRMDELQKKVLQFNLEQQEIHMGIAYGYEQFDENMDEDIQDTAKRADRMMYQNKFRMKQEMAANNDR